VAGKAYARRYSQAVFEIALENNELEQWLSDLTRVVSVVEDAALKAFLENPKYHFDDKARLLSEGLEGVNPLALNLVCLLITRNRLEIIGDIAEEYRLLLDSYRGIERAEVTSAVPLDDEDEQKLGEFLSKVAGKKVVLKSEVDPGLLGGIVARIGGKLLDGSTRSKLIALKKALAAGEVSR